MTSVKYGLYEEVVEITTDYMGPASRRFIDRQIINHLDKKPQELNRKDLESLIKWIELVTALITEDKKMISEFGTRLRRLGTSRRAV